MEWQLEAAAGRGRGSWQRWTLTQLAEAKAKLYIEAAGNSSSKIAQNYIKRSDQVCMFVGLSF